MKKYLMIGFVAAVAFASCSKNDFETYSPEEVVKAEYDAKFIAEFGNPNPNHDWGFGSGTRAFTRATGDFANYSGPYADAHLWTAKGFQAPDALSPGQKLRVQYYFQTNKITNPNQPNYGVKDFFMQQVYDGATDPITNYKTGNYSSESYVDAAGNNIDSGEQMNKLSAGSDHEHVYNFNNSNYPQPIPNVANWNQTVQDDHSQEHEDQIMLMLNTKTDCFGYLNSSNSVYYDDQWTLVSSATIDNYCDVVDPTGYQAFLAAHAGVEDKAVNDEWGQKGRGFMGFDFKLMPNPDPFLSTTAKFSHDGGWLTEVYDQKLQQNCKYYYDGTNFVKFTDYNTEIIINDEVLHYLDAQTNHYAADVKGVGGQDNLNDYNNEAAYDENGTNDATLYLNHIPGQQSDKRALNLKFIKKMVDAGYYPVDTKNLRLWAKINDLTDGFYSDWIVSFMLATQGPGLPDEPDEPEEYTGEYDGRIMAEDLTVLESTDWDFNDVVIDYAIRNGVAHIRLQAAGGTLPLTVGGSLAEDGSQVNGGIEIHGKFGVGTGTMVNTGIVEKSAVKFDLTDKTYSGPADILLCVQKTVNGTKTWVPLTAYKGQPCAKFVAEKDTPWCDEYANIKLAWGNFENYVESGSGKFVGSGKDELYFDRTLKNERVANE